MCGAALSLKKSTGIDGLQKAALLNETISEENATMNETPALNATHHPHCKWWCRSGFFGPRCGWICGGPFLTEGLGEGNATKASMTETPALNGGGRRLNKGKGREKIRESVEAGSLVMVGEDSHEESSDSRHRQSSDYMLV